MEIFQFYLRIFWKGFQYLNNLIIKDNYNKPNPTGVILIRHWNSKLWKRSTKSTAVFRLSFIQAMVKHSYLSVGLRLFKCGRRRSTVLHNYIHSKNRKPRRKNNIVCQSEQRTHERHCCFTCYIVSHAYCCFFCSLLFILLIVVSFTDSCLYIASWHFSCQLYLTVVTLITVVSSTDSCFRAG